MKRVLKHNGLRGSPESKPVGAPHDSTGIEDENPTGDERRHGARAGAYWSRRRGTRGGLAPARPAPQGAGKEPGEIILQTGFSWAPDDSAALEGARVWKATQPQEYFTGDWHDPKAMYEKAEREVSDEEFAQSYIIGSDPDVHVQRIREVEELGPTVVCLQNASGAEPIEALLTYGSQVLPGLRGARV